MDFLKKIKLGKAITIVVTVAIFLFLSSYIFSQNAPVASGNKYRISPQDDDILKAFKISYELEAKGQFSSAVDALMKVYDSQSYEINLRLGWLYFNDKKYSESIGYYQTAIDLRPNSIEARLGYAYPSGAMENWDKLIEKYNEILTLDPNHYIANYRIGMIYYYRPDYQMAFKHFEKNFVSYPFDYSNLIMFAWTHFQLGDKKMAKKLFEKCLMLSPDDASALEGLKYIK